MAEVKWTQGQRTAIETDGGDLLVSAAAGSGKTAVLTQRAIRLMTGEIPMDADRMLIATFTNAAAGEMRRRIRQKLAEMLSEQPDDSLLRRQMRLLDTAQIGTVHSFCQRLIRQHFDALDIAPNFRLMGEEEGRLLRRETAEAVIAGAYAADDPAFPELVELLGTARSDEKVVDTLLGVYDFVSAHPFYHHWMDEKLALYSGAGGAADSVWGQALIRYARSVLDYCLVENTRLIEACRGDAALEKSYLPAMTADEALLHSLYDTLSGGGWDAVADALGSVTYARMGSIRGEHPDKEAVKAGRDELKKVINKLCESFGVREADFKADIVDLLPKIACLFGLVKQFDADYTAAKRARGMLDFTDLEQLSITLLVNRRPDGSYLPTDLAREVQGRFDIIMVDEYQDINAAQDLIFRAVGRGDNLFMVGDVKQSIYRFRQASPELFIRKMDSFVPVGQGFPALVRLSNNFRSRREVTDAVNAVFTLLMSREVGEIDYTEAEHLIPAEGPPMPSAGCAFIAIDTANLAEGEDALELEADYVAAHIRALIDAQTPIRDGEGMRPVEPGDIALLLSAPRTSALPFIRALERVGIPATSDRRPEFLTAYEIAPLVGLLSALDNPLREVELTSALLSPLFGLTPDHLAVLRVEYGRESLALSLRRAAGEGREPYVSAHVLFEDMRRLSLILPPHELLTHLYERTGYEVAVGMMKGGAQRLGNLRLLVDYAAGQVERGYQGLSDFVGYLDQLRRRGQDLTAAAGAANMGVSVLSIHQSKGLEYPVVYLCHLGKGINRTDLRERAIIHPEYGFASVRRDPALHIQYDSLPYTAVKLESERALMSEELRKLYVAMTRARDRLVMTCTVKDPIDRLDALRVPLTKEGRLPAYRVRSAYSMAEWLMLCLAHTQEDSRFSPIPVTVVEDFDRAAARPTNAVESAEAPQADPVLVNEWARRLDFAYPHTEDIGVPAKLSVSQLTKTDVTARFLRRPGFLSPEGLSPTERGNAVHLFMQRCDYRRAAEDPEGECRRLFEMGLITEAQHRAVDIGRIRAFFRGQLGRRVLQSDRVLREFEFVAPAGRELVARYMPNLAMGNQPMMIQGIADCIFFEGERAILLDYKTDRVAEPAELAARYEAQLAVYRRLLPAFLGCEIAESYIYAFYLNTEITMIDTCR